MPDTDLRVQSYARRATAGDEAEDYEGLPIFAFPGLHAFAAIMAGAELAAGGRVLDVAAGSGALARRLADQGFDVVCCDAEPQAFLLHGTLPFVAANLDEDFRALFDGPFDGVIGLEIIEHLENPRHFVRQCAALLKPGGGLILSTPNLDTPRSILNFVRHGTFKFFDDHHHAKDGHISPLSQWQLKTAIADGGLDLRALETVGAPYGTGPRHLGAKLLGLLARRNPYKAGVIVVASATKPRR